MNKILILGAKGMLGTQLMKLYGNDAVGWDKETFNFAEILKFRSQVAQLNPQVIINCVAYNDVDAAEENIDLPFSINARGVGDLATICKNLNTLLVHFSTNYVFDGKKGEYAESDEPNPLSVYGKSKFEGEKLLQKNCNQYYLIRTSVLFGPHGTSPQSKKSFVELMLDLASKASEIKAVADEVNSLTFVVDLANQIKVLLEQQKPYGIFHIVNSGQASWYDYAKEIFAIKKVKIDLKSVKRVDFPRKAQTPKKAVLLNTKLASLRPWQEALREFLTSKI